MLVNRLIQMFDLKISRIYSYQNWHGLVILTTLSLPFFCTTSATAQVSKTIKASESQAKQYVQTMNKAQQDYYAQNSGFTSSIANLGLGIKPESPNYKYSISTGNKAVFNYGVSQQPNLKNFVGGVFLIGTTTQTILCQSAAASTTKPANPINTNGKLACAAGTAKI
ncbi:MAG: type IV pilin-like G/H family protein [Microcoleus anatoxicus]|uniref:type IV pilin-like G/H family protein n=1 Tax=Microcoleus anatoxicus TaxID=2705319 RepID=UPI00366E933A